MNQRWIIVLETDPGFCCGPWTKEMVDDTLAIGLEGHDGIKVLEIVLDKDSDFR